MEMYDVVMKLVGPVVPVGETNTDDARFENLEELLKLMEKLHLEVDRMADHYTDHHAFSISRAGKRCNKYLDWLGIEE